MTPRRARLLLTVALVGVAITLGAQGRGSLLNLRGRTDANGYLLTSNFAASGPESALQNFANMRLRTDANGYLLTAPGAGSAAGAGPFYAVDGTAALPAYSFASEPTLGFWRNGAGSVTLQGVLMTTSSIFATNFSAGTTSQIYWTARATMQSPSDGAIGIGNQAYTIGSLLKVDALPTVASGFGTSPAVTAGSTPLAGSVNVGTGGIATTGVINFLGTAFPSAPFCLATPSLTNVPTRATTVSTTQLTLTTSTAWTASDVVGWICISSK